MVNYWKIKTTSKYSVAQSCVVRAKAMETATKRGLCMLFGLDFVYGIDGEAIDISIKRISHKEYTKEREAFLGFRK